MSTTTALLECLPPSERDLDAYQLVMGEEKSTREVARLLKISQMRVRQLIKRVGKFLVRMAPEAKDPVKQYQRTYVAEALGLVRLKCLYREAMQAYRDSRGKKTVIVETPAMLGGSRVVQRTTECLGEIKYLQMAMRISAQMAKIPDNLLLTEAYGHLAEDADDEQLQAEIDAEFGTDHPLNEDCSPSGEFQTTDDDLKAQFQVVSQYEEKDYDHRQHFVAGVAKRFAPPAHQPAIVPAAAREEASAVAGPEPRRPLNRQERRTRARLLKKARGK